MEKLTAYPGNENITLYIDRGSNYFDLRFTEANVIATGDAVKQNLDAALLKVEGAKFDNNGTENFYIRWLAASDKSAEILAKLDELLQLTGKPESFATAGASHILIKAASAPFFPSLPVQPPLVAPQGPPGFPAGMSTPFAGGFAPMGAPLAAPTPFAGGFPGLTPFGSLPPGIAGGALAIAPIAPGASKGRGSKKAAGESQKLLASNAQGWQLYTLTKTKSFFIPMAQDSIKNLPKPKSLISFDSKGVEGLGTGYKVAISGRSPGTGKPKVYPGTWLDQNFYGWRESASPEDIRAADGGAASSAPTPTSMVGSISLGGQGDGDALALSRIVNRASASMTREEIRSGDSLVVFGPTHLVQPTLSGSDVIVQFNVGADKIVALVRVPIQTPAPFPQPMIGAPQVLSRPSPFAGINASPFGALPPANPFAGALAASVPPPSAPFTFAPGVPGGLSMFPKPPASPSRPPAPPGIPSFVQNAPPLPPMFGQPPSAPLTSLFSPPTM